MLSSMFTRILSDRAFVILFIFKTEAQNKHMAVMSSLTHPFLLFLYTLAILSVGTPYFSEIYIWKKGADFRQVLCWKLLWSSTLTHVIKETSLTASINPLSVGDFSIRASNTSSASFLTYSSTAERRGRRKLQLTAECDTYTLINTATG